ncbi:MAG: O-antigen ligase family protein [Bryobacteraceae bacterium]
MSESQAMDRTVPLEWPQIRAESGLKFSILFWSGLAAASIPLSISLYWIIFWLAPGFEGSLLRVSVFACSFFLAFIWYRAPLSHAEVNLIRVLGIAAFLLLIPTLMATQRSHAIAGWLKTVVLFTICCFVARGLRHPPTARVFGIALLAGGVILIAFILYTYVRNVGFAIPTYKTAREFKGIEERAGVPLNSIAFAAVITYLAGLCLMRITRLLIFIGIPLFVTSSLFTGSRAPLAILIASLFVMLCINGFRSRSLLMRVATALFASGVVLGGIAIVVLVSDKDLSGVTEGRSHLWSVGLHKFVERPLFGYGYESWRDDLVSRLPGEYELTFALAKSLGGGYHNEYISVLAEEGVIGGVAAGLIVWLLLRSSWLLAFRQWGAVHTKQWPLFACVFLLLRANFEVPGLFGYGQDPVDYIAYVLVAIVLSRFSVEEDWARLIAQKKQAQ